MPGGQFHRARSRPANCGYVTRDRTSPLAIHDLPHARARSAPFHPVLRDRVTGLALPWQAPVHVPKPAMTCRRAARAPPSHDPRPRAIRDRPCRAMRPNMNRARAWHVWDSHHKSKLSNGKLDQDSHPTHARLASLDAWNGRGSRTSRMRVRDVREARPVCRVLEGKDLHPPHTRDSSPSLRGARFAPPHEIPRVRENIVHMTRIPFAVLPTISRHGIRPKATPGVPKSRVALQIRRRVWTRILPSRDSSALAPPARWPISPRQSETRERPSRDSRPRESLGLPGFASCPSAFRADHHMLRDRAPGHALPWTRARPANCHDLPACGPCPA